MHLVVRDIISATGGRLVLPPGVVVPTAVSGVTTDSRKVAPGHLFVALRGPGADGHQFVEDALARGAVLSVVAAEQIAAGPVTAGPALVVADPLRALGAIAALHRRTLPVTVVGITGSVGKTTTVGLCAEVLAVRFNAARSAESWNAELGVALALLGLDLGVEVAVIEMAMRGLGQIRELVEMALPRIGAVTTIGDTHLELLGTRENIAAAKAELLEGLPADGTAIVSADEPLTERLVRDVRCPVVRVGLSPEADVRATEIRCTPDGCAFVLDIGGRQGEVTLSLPGTHQVRNALVAAAVGHSLGLGLHEIAPGLARARQAKMRQEIIHLGELLVVDDTYNASPQSMQAAFDVVVLTGRSRRRVLALGEMLELGPDSPQFHRRVGRQAAELQPALLLAVGPNARWYLEGAAAVGLAPGAAAWAKTTEEAIPVLRQAVRPGDVVLIKGSRGIEMEKVLEGLRAGMEVTSP
ncbi:MAG: UDP-N-acetylmuramoyl-tripeptide--D-alanyl-D-alanine ligase [bacterium]|nr:UDP-N-acetylmuramoyl-tripeptide--D-alanyl-D-alanine ligase [bacterium]